MGLGFTVTMMRGFRTEVNMEITHASEAPYLQRHTRHFAFQAPSGLVISKVKPYFADRGDSSNTLKGRRFVKPKLQRPVASSFGSCATWATTVAVSGSLRMLNWLNGLN